MLNSNDIDLIKATRSEITEGRLQDVTLHIETITGADPYTKEPIKTVSDKVVQAEVTGFTGVVGGEKLFVNGVEIIAGDVNMVFSVDINLTGVKRVTHNSVDYMLYSVQEKGLGAVNRRVCVARRVT